MVISENKLPLISYKSDFPWKERDYSRIRVELNLSTDKIFTSKSACKIRTIETMEKVSHMTRKNLRLIDKIYKILCQLIVNFYVFKHESV